MKEKEEEAGRNSFFLSSLSCFDSSLESLSSETRLTTFTSLPLSLDGALVVTRLGSTRNRFDENQKKNRKLLIAQKNLFGKFSTRNRKKLFRCEKKSSASKFFRTRVSEFFDQIFADFNFFFFFGVKFLDCDKFWIVYREVIPDFHLEFSFWNTIAASYFFTIVKWFRGFGLHLILVESRLRWLGWTWESSVSLSLSLSLSHSYTRTQFISLSHTCTCRHARTHFFHLGKHTSPFTNAHLQTHTHSRSLPLFPASSRILFWC